MEQEQTFVFVYGTLRRGCRNHHLLLGAHCLGLALTVEPYALFVGQCPYVQRAPKDHWLPLSRISGEVYAVDAATFAALDELEDHPHDYCRELVEVTLQEGRIVRAWLYFHPEPEGVWIPSGDVLAPPR